MNFKQEKRNDVANNEIKWNNGIPLYKQLKEILFTQINDGIIGKGEKLPSERELCQEYKVSRITVRQALDELVKEGLVYRSHGKGTFVSHNRVEQPLFTFTTFENSLLNKGIKPGTRFLDFNFVENSYQLSRILEVPLSQNLAKITLLGLGDDTPMAFYTSYFEKELGIRMKELAVSFIEKGQSVTTFELYKLIPGVTSVVVDQTFEASIADSYIAKLLKIKKGSPVLIVESKVYSAESRPLEYKTAVYRGDKYRFSIVRNVF
jgi:GntR family transcriptional regulator